MCSYTKDIFDLNDAFELLASSRLPSTPSDVSDHYVIRQASTLLLCEMKKQWCRDKLAFSKMRLKEKPGDAYWKDSVRDWEKSILTWEEMHQNCIVSLRIHLDIKR